MQVKICGITRLEDALCAVENGATALGFIFYPFSPRFIEPRKAGEIIGALPAHTVKVGVFVNEKERTVRRIFDECGLDMLQLHGDETPRYCRRFEPRFLIKALELKTQDDVKRAAHYDVAAVVADARHAGLYGGTGKTSDWELARQVAGPLILSGGLGRHNVLGALRAVKPAALDINSTVEKAPGKKDAAKIKYIMRMIERQTAGDASPRVFTGRGDK
jgi:phosphoribosylanthranilate isomerase